MQAGANFLEELNKIPEGMPVNYHSPIGSDSCIQSKTRAGFWIVADNQTVTMIEGKAGIISIEALTFDCAWCKEAFGDLTTDEYRNGLFELGGFDKDSGLPICDNCAIEAAADERTSQGDN